MAELVVKTLNDDGAAELHENKLNVKRSEKKIKDASNRDNISVTKRVGSIQLTIVLKPMNR